MDYDQILPTDFAPSTDEPPTAPLDERLDGIDAAAHAPDDEGDGEYKPEESAEQSKGKSATQGLSEEEKKARQKMQNRKAAERSRNKKREEQTTLELTVNNIQKENDQLRQRLAAILASRPQASASASTSHPPDIDPTLSNAVGSSGTGIDYAYLGKLQSELASAKSTLLERELELARMRGAETGDEVDVLRHLLLSHNTTLTSLQAETGTLHSMIDHLRTERDELARQGRVVTRELAGRRALRDAENGMERDVAAQGGEGRIVGVERALLDIRGWMDGAAKTWDQTSVLPPPPVGANGSADVEQ